MEKMTKENALMLVNQICDRVELNRHNRAILDAAIAYLASLPEPKSETPNSPGQ